MNRAPLIFTLCATFVLGCATASVVSSSMAVAAQPSSPGQFAECFGATVYLAKGGNLNAAYVPDKTVLVPTGWTVVGGGSAGPGGPMMVLCH